MSVVVVAEKPSVARDVARVLGASQRAEGYLHGNGYQVTWALGHLLRLAEPDEIRPEWKRWTRESLPLLPAEWPLKVAEETKAQFALVKRLLADRAVSEVVCATDAGREGELIFRYIQSATGLRQPVRRLWISSLTPEAIRRGFLALRPQADFDALADAAHGRARADWLVGMNLSRAATLAGGELFSVGRVQTPTLALLAERERAIQAFVPEDYLEVVADFGPEAEGLYRGTWFRGERPAPEARRLPQDGEEARAVVERVRQGRAQVESASSETRRVPPPLLYDLTELQRHANRLFGLSARQALQALQGLYEKHKLVTYPRTDSRHLSRDVAATLPAVVAAVAGPYRAQLAPGTGERPLSRRFVDDAKVSDHHAIVPTGVSAEGLELSLDERRLYDLVCRRLLMAWHDEHVFAVTTVVTRVESGAAADRFHSSGTAVQQLGWKALDPPPPRAARAAAARDSAPDADDEQALPAGLRPGQARSVEKVETLQKRTRPPRRFTDATLLTAMETAGQTLDDRELSEAMRERGLGTPATRAEIIETLIRREYVERQGKALHVTARGLRLIDAVHPDVKSPALTGEWEAELERIRKGEAALPGFMRRIEQLVRDLVGQQLAGAPVVAPPAVAPPPAAAPPPAVTPSGAKGLSDAPAPGHGPRGPSSLARGGAPRDDAAARAAGSERGPVAAGAAGGPSAPQEPIALDQLLRDVFKLPSFRPHQEQACRAVADGQDVLLVMPTGAGKSLCYQLPGLARRGTTLVVSPLIALMEDQVGKLQQLGLRAERIHSGRERAASRAACQEYLAGRLDFLFIAPERLRVPGFPELLARRQLALVAIDEAHCISEWGHDFRPDYRLLGARLPGLRPAPVIALTATATPRVQADIATQLGLLEPRNFIHGFRRTNIAIEVAQVTQGQARAEAVAALLADASRRPAIVYAPTRKESEGLAAQLSAAGLRAAPYHAGLSAPVRERAQTAFLGGRLDVVVATIAFGMGVDKADVRTVAHTGLPGSLEGYYQEIGRAGRDGLPSRAVLLYSWADRRTHDFFLKRDYPEPEVLLKLFRALPAQLQPIEGLRRAARLDDDEFEAALEKLWIHGGARVEGELAAVGQPGWRPSYVRQREHKQAQLDEILRFAEGHGCRMLALLRHFGDQEDRTRPCGQCDACVPEACRVKRHRAPTGREAEALKALGAALRQRDGQGSAQLHREIGGEALLDRKLFEQLLGGAARAGLVRLERDAFEKDGRTIAFQRVYLTGEGRAGGFETLAGVELVEEAGTPGKKGLPKPTRRRGSAAASAATAAAAEAPRELVEKLKAWRLAEARRRGVPAFRILTDRTLLALAAERPSNEEGLLQVPGLGPRLAQRHGTELLRLLAG